MNFSYRYSNKLPAVREFFNRAIDYLAQGRSIIVRLPDYAEIEAIEEFVEEELNRRSYWAHSISAQIFGQKTDVFSGKEKMEGGARDLIWIRGVSETNESAKKKLREWFAGQICGRVREKESTVPFFSIIKGWQPSFMNMPGDDVKFATLWFCGRPSELEMRMICRDYLCEMNEMDILSRWKEMIVPVLVGSDIELASIVWDLVAEKQEILIDALCKEADKRNWDAKWLNSLSFKDLWMNWHAGATIPRQWEQAWLSGAVQFNHERGWEPHILALCALKQQEEIDHRIWRGQAGLLLPYIDDLRLAVCTYMTKKYGAKWPFMGTAFISCFEEEELKKSPLSCELGLLDMLLKTKGLFPGESDLCEVVSQAREMRNNLAHYSPVEFQRFRSLHILSQKLARRI